MVSSPNKFNRYIEPFCGSACLFFALEPNKAILGDINYELTTTFNAIRKDPYLVLECFKRLPRGKNSYYKIRSINVNQLSENEIAARFLYLNHYCFNGLFRTNLQGNFNVPFSESRLKVIFNEKNIENASEVLRNTHILNKDFEATISYAKKGDFVYLDPPYAIKEQRVFSHYHPKSFSSIDLKRFKDILYELDKKKVFFLVSYQDSDEAKQILTPWNTHRLWTRRNIAGFAGNRKGVYELIGANFPIGDRKYAN